MDPVEKRLTGAYTRALEVVNHLPENSPNLARAIVKMKQAKLALRRYQAKRN